VTKSRQSFDNSGMQEGLQKDAVETVMLYIFLVISLYNSRYCSPYGVL
jgi:hypothetical protein